MATDGDASTERRWIVGAPGILPGGERANVFVAVGQQTPEGTSVALGFVCAQCGTVMPATPPGPVPGHRVAGRSFLHSALLPAHDPDLPCRVCDRCFAARN